MGNPKFSDNPQPVATRRLKICLLVSSIFLVILGTVILTLSLTIFKPKNPYISIHPVGLENFELFSPNSTTDEPLNLVITIVNPNYGSFRCQNCSGSVKYRDAIVAEVPIKVKWIPARSTINVSTSAGIMTRKMISEPKFWSDVEAGSLNLTPKATLRGKVQLLKVLKLKATIYVSCALCFNISSISADSSCISKIKV